MLIIKIVEKGIGYFSSIAMLMLMLGALCLLGMVFREEGIAGVWNTISKDVTGVTLKFIPVLVVFFVITGVINHLQQRHSKEFEDTLAGKKGTFKMAILAALMPGPAGGQQLQEAWNKSGPNKTKSLLCLTAMMALSINAILFRSKVLGGPLTMIWFLMGLALFFQVWIICKIKWG